MGGFRQAQEYNAQSLIPSVLAATATEQHPIFVAPVKCKVLAVSIVPQAAVTGDNTNTKNLNVINKGAAGAGTTEVANLDLITGANLVAFDESAIPLNTTYVDGVSMSEGDTLTVQVEKVGTGVLLPNLHVMVDFIPL